MEEISRLTVSSLFVAAVKRLDIETSFRDDEVVRHHDGHDAEQVDLVGTQDRDEYHCRSVTRREVSA